MPATYFGLHWFEFCCRTSTAPPSSLPISQDVYLVEFDTSIAKNWAELHLSLAQLVASRWTFLGRCEKLEQRGQHFKHDGQHRQQGQKWPSSSFYNMYDPLRIRSGVFTFTAEAAGAVRPTTVI